MYRCVILISCQEWRFEIQFWYHQVQNVYSITIVNSCVWMNIINISIIYLFLYLFIGLIWIIIYQSDFFSYLRHWGLKKCSLDRFPCMDRGWSISMYDRSGLTYGLFHIIRKNFSKFIVWNYNNHTRIANNITHVFI